MNYILRWAHPIALSAQYPAQNPSQPRTPGPLTKQGHHQFRLSWRGRRRRRVRAKPLINPIRSTLIPSLLPDSILFISSSVLPLVFSISVSLQVLVPAWRCHLEQTASGMWISGPFVFSVSGRVEVKLWIYDHELVASIYGFICASYFFHPCFGC